MTTKDFFINALTPKDTEEMKPGFYVQKRRSGEYKQILPLAWNGKFLVKEQLRTVFTLRTILFIALICFIAWSYVHDTSELMTFYNNVTSNPIAFCQAVDQFYQQPICSDDDAAKGSCMQNGFVINISPIETTKDGV